MTGQSACTDQAGLLHTIETCRHELPYFLCKMVMRHAACMALEWCVLEDSMSSMCICWQASELFDAANQTASEAFAAIRTVAAFSLQGPLVAVYEKLLEKPQAAVAARAHASGLGFGFSQFAVFSVYALAFWYGGQLIRHGEMDFAQVLKVCTNTV